METLIGEYEISYTSEPALFVIHHVIRGYDTVLLAGDDVVAFVALLGEAGKRIRSLAEYQIIFGGSDDLSFYSTASGQRAAYFNAVQVGQLRQLVQQ
jgi:hypothetical protein